MLQRRDAPDAKDEFEISDLLPHAASSDKSDEDDTSTIKLQQEQSHYADILHTTRNKVRILVCVSLIVPLLAGTREFILEIYMQSLSPHTTITTISTLIFVRRLWCAMIQFLVSSLGDKYGHDRMLLFVFIFSVIGLFIECTANSLWLFTLGFFMSCVPIRSLTMAYMALLLPHKYAVSEMANYFGIASVVYILGPPISGLIVDHLSYRSVFWLNAMILSFCTVINIVFITGSQSKLISLQQTLSQRFIEQQHDNNHDEDLIFPVCRLQQTRDVSWNAFFRDIEHKQLVLLITAIVQNNAGWTIETIMLMYFLLFFVSRFESADVSTLYISALSFSVLLTCGVSCIVLPKCIARILPKYVFVISISSLLFVGVMLLAMHGYQEQIAVYWLLCPVIGALFGIFHIGTEMCILETQPKQHSGKVAGAKAALAELFRACGVLFVGVAWSAPYFNAIWIGNAVCASIVFVLSFVVWWNVFDF